jgi:prepilin-type N-terminal cleavage/methylation domain-containing protein
MTAKKTRASGSWRVTGDRKNRVARGAYACHLSPVARHPSAFTLVELLVVISIIGLLAAFIFPVTAAIEKNKYITRSRLEMGQVGTAIDDYKDTYGFYPPDNPGNPLLNQLYYELIGTTNTASGTFQTLDGSSTVTSGTLTSTFGGVSAFINCSKPGSGEQVVAGRNFLHELRPTQTTPYNGVTLLVASVGGPDANYAPLTGSASNPWRYISSNPTNNPNSYDLWVQLSISGNKYLVCNWNNKQAQVNSPLP